MVSVLNIYAGRRFAHTLKCIWTAEKIRIFANFGVIFELITYSDINIGIETNRKQKFELFYSYAHISLQNWAEIKLEMFSRIFNEMGGRWQ